MDLTQLGIGGIFALLVLREVFGFLKNRKDNPGHNSQKLIMDQFRQIRETQTAITQGLARIEGLLRDRLPK